MDARGRDERSKAMRGAIRVPSSGRSTRTSPSGSSKRRTVHAAARQSRIQHATQLSRDVQLAFLRACLPELGSDYHAAVEDFVRASVKAFQLAHTPATLTARLQLDWKTGDEELDSLFASRPLDREEIEMRTAWLELVYTTILLCDRPLGALVPDSLSSDCAEPIAPVRLAEQAPSTNMTMFVTMIQHFAAKGYDYTRLRLEQAIKGTRGNLESAKFSQAMRLVFITLDVTGWQARPHIN